jgi:hypothetical protein
MAGEIFPDETDDDGFCMVAILLVRSKFEMVFVSVGRPGI